MGVAITFKNNRKLSKTTTKLETPKEGITLKSSRYNYNRMKGGDPKWTLNSKSQNRTRNNIWNSESKQANRERETETKIHKIKCSSENFPKSC